MEEQRRKRTRASLEEFLQIVLKAKNTDEACELLNVEKASFDQRLRKEKKTYPEQFDALGVDTRKFIGSTTRARATGDEAWAIVAKLKGITVEELKQQTQDQEEAKSKGITVEELHKQREVAAKTTQKAAKASK
jgi:hypothetical protein